MSNGPYKHIILKKSPILFWLSDQLPIGTLKVCPSYITGISFLISLDRNWTLLLKEKL